MNNHHGNLYAQAVSNSRQNLITNPMGGWRADIKGIYQTCPDRNECGTHESERKVLAKFGDQQPRSNGADRNSNDKRQVVDPTLSSTRLLNCLEIDRNVIQEKKEGSGKEEGVRKGCGDSSLAKQSRHEHRSVS